MAKQQQKSKEKKAPQISREDFIRDAKPLEMNIAGNVVYATVKEFRGKSGEVDGTGSLGWFFNDKINVKVGDKVLKVQPTVSFVVVGSKEE